MASMSKNNDSLSIKISVYFPLWHPQTWEQFRFDRVCWLLLLFSISANEITTRKIIDFTINYVLYLV